MFRKSTEIYQNKISDIFRYIDSPDIYNSLLYRRLQKLDPTESYILKTNRYDLISSDIYGDNIYAGLLQLYLGKLESELKVGSVLHYPKLTDIKSLIQGLNELK
jgi:hypothetical protein